MRVLTIVGARPQFIKARPVGKALVAAGHDQFLVHTGQHYDFNMSDVFFQELGIPQPEVNLEIGSGCHGQQTGQMLIKLEEVMQAQKPDWVVVYGDTNSTMAGALAAVKLQIPLAHVEAGLRSFNRSMPEEHNRVLTDHSSDLLFCPTQTAMENLAREGIGARANLVGDVMFDAVLEFAEMSRQRSTILADLDLAPKEYLLATVHRPGNTDSVDNLRDIVNTLAELNETVIWPVHPRTRKCMEEANLDHIARRDGSNLRVVNATGYLDMLALEQNARLILTDSGGVQKEAFFFGVPCVTMRTETEWTETVASGWNTLVGSEPVRIKEAVKGRTLPSGPPPALFGDGCASQKIVQLLEETVVAPESNYPG